VIRVRFWVLISGLLSCGVTRDGQKYADNEFGEAEKWRSDSAISCCKRAQESDALNAMRDIGIPKWECQIGGIPQVLKNKLAAIIFNMKS
jgi:hypothetical protein